MRAARRVLLSTHFPPRVPKTLSLPSVSLSSTALKSLRGSEMPFMVKPPFHFSSLTEYKKPLHDFSRLATPLPILKSSCGSEMPLIVKPTAHFSSLTEYKMPPFERFGNEMRRLDVMIDIHDKQTSITSDHYTWMTNARQPYGLAHLYKLRALIDEKNLMPDLLQCENLEEVLQLSSILLYEGLEDCIEGIIKNEAQVRTVLESINQDNNANEARIKERNQSDYWSKDAFLGRTPEESKNCGDYNYYQQKFMTPNVNYHRILVTHKDICREIRILLDIVYHNHIPNDLSMLEANKIVHAIKTLKKDDVWDLALTQMKGDFLTLALTRPDLISLAINLANKIHPSEKTLALIYDFFNSHPHLAISLVAACRRATQDWKLSLTEADFQRIIDKKMIMEKAFDFTSMFFKGIKDHADLALEDTRNWIAKMQKR